MARKYMDCRTVPSDKQCTLAMSGEEEDLLEAAAQHAVKTHGHKDGPELRRMLRSNLREIPGSEAGLHA